MKNEKKDIAKRNPRGFNAENAEIISGRELLAMASVVTRDAQGNERELFNIYEETRKGKGVDILANALRDEFKGRDPLENIPELAASVVTKVQARYKGNNSNIVQAELDIRELEANVAVAVEGNDEVALREVQAQLAEKQALYSAQMAKKSIELKPNSPYYNCLNGAAGTAATLQKAGVPCHLVIGFMSDSAGIKGGYHAWVVVTDRQGNEHVIETNDTPELAYRKPVMGGKILQNGTAVVVDNQGWLKCYGTGEREIRHQSPNSIEPMAAVQREVAEHDVGMLERYEELLVVNNAVPKATAGISAQPTQAATTRSLPTQEASLDIVLNPIIRRALGADEPFVRK